MCNSQFTAKFLEKVVKNCSCIEPCSRTSFETDISYALFNDVKNTSSLVKAFLATSKGRYAKEEKDWKEFLR